jgi:hypothetical protein
MIDRLTKKTKNNRMTQKNEINAIKYDMPLKARIILEGVTMLSMMAAPFLWAFMIFVVAVQSLWGSLIDMPLEVRQKIMVEYIKNGVAKRRVESTET